MRLWPALLLALLTPAAAEAIRAPTERLLVADVELPEVTPLDLNSATIAELVTLPGVGEQRARAIVQFRTRRPFRRPADLMRVPGIGRRLYFRLKPWVRVLAPAEERRSPTN
ncbi:MAG: helix-hairpin-helix domain-containing protein [Myxococcota bacterium]